jgi:hypothetical protein
MPKLEATMTSPTPGRVEVVIKGRTSALRGLLPPPQTPVGNEKQSNLADLGKDAYKHDMTPLNNTSPALEMDVKMYMNLVTVLEELENSESPQAPLSGDKTLEMLGGDSNGEKEKEEYGLRSELGSLEMRQIGVKHRLLEASLSPPRKRHEDRAGSFVRKSR